MSDGQCVPEFSKRELVMMLRVLEIAKYSPDGDWTPEELKELDTWSENLQDRLEDQAEAEEYEEDWSESLAIDPMWVAGSDCPQPAETDEPGHPGGLWLPEGMDECMLCGGKREVRATYYTPTDSGEAGPSTTRLVENVPCPMCTGPKPVP